MEKIIWDDSFDIQVDVIDQQHRRLVELMNRLIAVQEEERHQMKSLPVSSATW